MVSAGMSFKTLSCRPTNYGFFCAQFHEIYAPYQAYATIRESGV